MGVKFENHRLVLAACVLARLRRGETMATLPYVTVDAFTSVKFGGNPAAVVIFPKEDLARALETRKEQEKAKNHEVRWTYGCMPARTALAGKDGFPPDAFLANVAKEMNLSETAFVKPRPPPRRAQQPAAEREAESESSDADSVASGKKRRDEPDHMDYDLRWFTPSGAEVDLCGHATLATAHALFELGPGAVPPETHLRFHTRSGVLVVSPVGDGQLELSFPASPPTMTLIGGRDVRVVDSDGEEEPDPELDFSPADVAAALGMPPSAAATIRIVGRNDVGDTFCVLPDPKTLVEVKPNLAKIAALGGRGLVATAPGGVATKQGGEPVDFTCRFWGPNIGIPEDPVTGSAFCGLAPYWKKELGRKGGEEMIGYQASARGGLVRAACVKHKAAFGGEDETRVHIRGRAVSVMKGEILGDGFAADEPER